ncbi:MAG: glycosyltransferase [Candidatus Methanoperedens sp.]|nr:glycosyltransferase [Candidatus Methanoperedens sp.]
MKNTFFDKNILLLFPTDENQYFNFHYGALKNYFQNIYRFNFVEYFRKKGIRNTERYIANLISDKEIDIVMSYPFATDYQLSVEFYSSLKKKIKIVFCMFDDENYFDVYSKYYCQIADAVITVDYFSVFGYEKLGIPSILFLPVFSKNNYHPVETEKDIDVCFLGNCIKNDRMKYINFLINNGIKVETFGIGSKNGFVEWNELSKIYSRSKINLNFAKLDKLNWINKDEPLLNRVRQDKGRPTEIALTRSFCLSEYSPSLKYIFEIGKEIDVFHNKEELLGKVKYYLSNESKREEIAYNAYKKALENYETEIYIPKVLKELNSILENTDKSKTENIRIYLSESFKIKSINGLTFSTFVLIKNGKIKYALELFAELFKYGVFNFLTGFYGGTIRIIRHKLKLFIYRDAIS